MIRCIIRCDKSVLFGGGFRNDGRVSVLLSLRTSKSHSFWSWIVCSLRPIARIAAVVLSLSAGGGLALAEERPGTDSVAGVEYEAQTRRLKVNVSDESFRRVMETVAEKAELEIHVHDPAESALTIEFDYLPFEEGLRELLKGKNSIAHRTSDGSRISRLWVLGEGSSVSQDRSTQTQPQQRLSASWQGDSADRAQLRPPPVQFARALEQLRQYEAETGMSARAQLKQMRASVDPDFDPELDGDDLSDEELLESVVESAIKRALPGGSTGSSAEGQAPTPGQ